MAKAIHRTIVESIEILTPTVSVFTLRFDDIERFEFVAGQYVMVDIPRGDEVVQKAYSIASPPSSGRTIELCIKRIEGGFVSTFFHESVSVGTGLMVSESMGNFIDRGVDRERVFVATGTGIAPIRSMIHDLYASGPVGPIWLFFGVREEAGILYREEWRRLAEAHATFHYLPTISRPTQWTGEVGWVQGLLEKYLVSSETKEVYVCGVVPMVKSVKPLLIELGVPRTQIHTEKYT